MTPDDSTFDAGPPDDVKDAAAMARLLAAKPRRTREEEEALNQARIKVAFWACRREGVGANWENLSFVMGSHADPIRPAYSRMVSQRGADENARISAARKRAADTGVFWGGPDRPPPTGKP